MRRNGFLRLRVARLMLVLPAIVSTGCILGISDLTGGENDGGSDASFDASSSDARFGDDATTPVDSSTTSSNDAGNDSGPFCPRIGAFFCEDFDGPDAALPGKFDYVYAPGESTVVESNVQFLSAPRSLAIATSATSKAALLTKNVSGTRIDVAFDFFIQNLSDNSTALTFTIGTASVELKPNNATQTDILEADNYSDGGVDYLQNAGSGGIPGATWVHLDALIDFPAHTLTVTMNGSALVSRTLDAAHWQTAGAASVSFGTGDSSNTAFDYDNVVIRLP